VFGNTAYDGDPTYHNGNGCGTFFALTTDSNGRLTTFTRLHVFEFNQKGGEDGDTPEAVVPDSAGNLYGTAQMGGDANCQNGLGCGIVFMLGAPLFGNGNPKERVLHVFENSDGRGPVGRLLLDPNSGALYGTTYGGGSTGYGTVFKLTPNAKKTRWEFTVLYNFNGSPDGAYPVASLIVNGQGVLFGTTQYGGTGKGFGNGTMFSLESQNGTWNEQVLLQFRLRDDGQHPFPGLTADDQGNFFAVSDANCGKHLTQPCGYALELVPQGYSYTAQILHTFYWADGSTLYGDALVRDTAGNLFGVAAYGGAHGNGSAYELQTGGGTYTFVKRYDFCALTACHDGALPFGLSMDSAGNLYGTTATGGPNGDGEVFVLSSGK
jgi:uncharacterized repeat protein (TIGR03803 family)